MANLVLFDASHQAMNGYLHELVFVRANSPVVSCFLVSVSCMLRSTIASLPAIQRSKLPPFTNLGEFINQYGSGGHSIPVVETTLLCIAQLADFMCLDEEVFEMSPDKTAMIAVSSGLIAGATASILPRGMAGVALAVHAVKLTLRLALHIQELADQLSPASAGLESDSWGIQVTGITETNARAMIGDFLAERKISPPKQPYISAVWPSAVTINGPPGTLSELKRYWSSVQTLASVPVQISGPYHAPHLKSATVPEDIMDLDLLHDYGPLTSNPRASLLSIRDGASYKVQSLKDLYTQVITDVLTSCQDFSAVLDHFSDNLKESCRPIFVGPMNETSPLFATVQARFPQKPITIFDQKQSPSSLRSSCYPSRKDKIAIVGMSGRFPGAQDTEEFWKVLHNGRDMHREVPPDRFDAETYYDPSGKGRNKSHTPFGCFVDNAGLFDPRFFNMSPREATQTDPMQRLALITAYEALEMAGYVPNRTPSTQLDRIGTFYGQTSDDWREINEAQDIDTYFITGGVRAFGPGRINYHFGFSGPSLSIDTACSSSMAAIHVACNSLWLRDCDTALAGGVNIMTNPDIFSGLSKGQFLSKVGPCQTFDDAADGYCRGDAVGSLVLKRLSDAEADNDNILGVIMSVATNHSADAISITHPHAGTQEILYKRVLSHAGVQPQEVSYVEMHGTGTQAGDATEMSSVSGVFAPPSLSRKVNEKLYLGSVKANVGHGEASSGVTAIVKVLLMMQHNTIPPHVGIKRDINRGFPDLAARNVYISKEPVSFPRPQSGTRKIFVNNFSAAGGNTAVMMEDGTARQLQGSDPRQAHVVAVSGRALSSLKLNLKNLAEHLTSHPNLSLPSLSYSTTARKIQHNYRFSVAGSNIASIKQALMDAAQSDILPVPAAPKIAFVFTGQGSMYAGIGAELFQTCTAYRESILEFDSIATGFGFPSIRALADGTDDGVISNLAPVLVQVAQVSIQMAMTRVWQAFGVCPDVVVGHSLGEYAALFASGILSASDTIFLVGSRAKLLESHCTSGSHAMLAIRGEMSSWRDLVPSDRFQIACMNSNTEIVLSGLADDIESCQSLLQGHGIQATKLNVPFAFHSSQVDPILGPFAQICSEVTFRKPICEVLSPLLGRPLEETTINADYCCRHARETVNFCEALSTSMSSNTIDASTVFVEVGPHPVCTGFIKSTLGASVAAFPSFHRKSKPWETLASSTSGLSNKGVNINWGEYHRDFESALELLKLPAYGWALSNYWIDYKNDWCLTKGLVMSAAKPVAILPSISTTSVQRVVKEEFTGTCNMVSAETDISRPDVKAVLSGHMVNGIPLCPSTLYADIGMTIGKYMYQRMFPDCKSEDLPCMNVCDMAVPKTLIGRESTSHVIKILAEATKSKDSINVAISSEEGEHASFKIQFGTASVWLEEWKRTGYLVEARMNALRENSDTSNTHVLQQTIAYKLFSSFVDYEKTFQGIKKVYLDPEHWEATAEVVLEVPNADQTFDVPPYWIDSIGHLSGFILNVQPTDDSKKNVFVSHGWQSLRLSQNLVPGRKYQTYVRMVEIKGTNLISGDVYCLENSQVIGLFGGVTFMRIPRTVLDQVLPRARPRATMARATNVDERQPTKARQEGISKPNGIIPNAASTTVAVKGLAHSLSVASQVLAIVAEECGVDQNELADPNSFADLGVDSLMQLAISSRMREEMELEVASSLFLSHPTVGALKEYLRQLEPEDALSTPASSSASELNSPSDDGLGSPTTSLASNDADELAIGSLEIHDEKKLDTSNEVSAPVVHPLTLSALIPNKKATSFLLQGNIKTATTKLFLFPDGGGSAASYAHIPDLSSDVVVFGLNSPFMTTPEEYTCGVSGMARYYLEEIRRRQPQGPYNFGGWSAGGVLAFEGAQQLIRQGEQVDRLILIDSPCPLTIEPLPIALHRWFSTLGLLGDGDSSKIPVWLLPHFQASINALSTYNARSIDPSKAPTTYIIWCEDGVCKNPTDPRPDPYPYGHAQFLLENKEDLGPQLWDAMVGMDNIKISHVPGNHFTMMRSPFVQNLGDKMREAFV